MGWSKDNGNGRFALEAGEFAQEQGDFAKTQGERVESVVEANKTRFLQAVDSVAARNTQYPSPQNGDTVRVTGEATTYRFSNGSWTKTDQYNPTAIDEVTVKLAETGEETKKIYSKNNTNRIPSLSFVSEKKLQPLVSFVDDDGARDILTKLKPISITHNIPFGIGLIGNRLAQGTGILIHEALELQNNLGWEVLNHSYKHFGFQEAGVTDEQVEYETGYAAEYMRGLGFDIKNFVYPGGQYNERSIRITAKYHNGALSTAPNVNPSPMSNYKLGRIGFPQAAPNNTLAWYKSKVDEAIANRGWLIWMLHCGDQILDANQLQILNDLIVYIKSVNVPIVNIQEGIDITGNIMSINDNQFWMDADGKNNIVNNIYPRNNSVTGTETVTFDTIPNDLDAGKTYVSSIFTSANVSKSPSGVRGMLTIYRAVNAFHSYRTYVDADKNVFVSYSNSSGNGWIPFSRYVTTSGSQEYILPTATIEGNSYFKFNMNPNPRRYDNTQYAIAKPVNPLPAGLIFSAHHNGSGGAVEVRLFNTTTTAITLTDFKWQFIITYL